MCLLQAICYGSDKKSMNLASALSALTFLYYLFVSANQYIYLYLYLTSNNIIFRNSYAERIHTVERKTTLIALL